MVPLCTGPIPIHVQYDGTRRVGGVLKRVVKKFKNGLSREAKEFYLAKAAEGKRPQVLDGSYEPVFGRWSRYTARPRPPEPVPEPEPVEAPDSLFENPPSQLPD